MLSVDEIHDHIAATSVAMGVLDTRTRQIAAANTAFAELLGRSLDETIGLRLEEYVDDAERLAAATTVVDSMRRGWIDAMEGYVEFKRGDGGFAGAYSWSVPLGSAPPHDSVLMGAATARSERPAGFNAYRVDPSRVILGALDHDWRFSDVGVRPAGLLSWPPGEEGRARLQELVHPSDVPVLLATLGRASVGSDATTIHVRVRGAEGVWLAACVTVSPLCADATPRFGVAICLLPDAEVAKDMERVVRLEEQLWHIAAEVRAGAMSTSAGMTYIDLTELSERQNEIVRRLVQGQRVTGIARDMFLSPSTVRNHLSASYRKLGVSSQSELIEKLRAGSQSEK